MKEIETLPIVKVQLYKHMQLMVLFQTVTLKIIMPVGGQVQYIIITLLTVQ